jgi:NADPH:quinone reductase-like Zn-dependent oxidoreductase
VAELPYEIATSQGVVLPLGISTAAAGLYQKHFLSLPYPTLDPESVDRTLIVWGGSSSVGSCCIQLAVASGVTVVTTASPKNFEYCRKLGASKVFDYHEDDVEDQIVEALKGKTVVGAYHAVGADGAVQSCARIVDRTKGKAIVVTVRGVPDEGIPDSVRAKASEYPLPNLDVIIGPFELTSSSLIERYFRRRCWTVYLARLPA